MSEKLYSNYLTLINGLLKFYYYEITSFYEMTPYNNIAGRLPENSRR